LWLPKVCGQTDGLHNLKYDPETGKPEWAPRVRMEKIRLIYQNDARGIRHPSGRADLH